MKTLLILLAGFSLVLNTGCKKSETNIDTSTIAQLDVKKYMGTWYEIARYDHKFEKGLVGCTANYYLNEDGTVKVVNSGYKDSFDGKFQSKEAKARIPDSTQPGKLEVAFFLNFYSDYFILELDENYTYALVGSSSSKYLWILSRTPTMNEDDLNFIKNRATTRGYDTSKLVWVKQ